MFLVTMSQTLQDGKLENKVHLLEIKQKLYLPPSFLLIPIPSPPPFLLIPTFSSIWWKLNWLLIIFSDILVSLEPLINQITICSFFLMEMGQISFIFLFVWCCRNPEVVVKPYIYIWFVKGSKDTKYNIEYSHLYNL